MMTNEQRYIRAMNYKEREAQNKFQIGDMVEQRYIVAINGKPQTANEVLWVSKDGSLIQLDFGDGEHGVCKAASYELAEKR
ncbi:MAG: hypothetical protein GOVbin1773_42 [Prokaryotic dsDNA virus sp.]|jgi:hypothetical protein|nr:MAG: hypothetical protein GOVbin1773_42 [Prokaryotic dsDNA virus sp.]|tara:strand:+ start:324 stop:566 length:243 start_codon:yes stop_codon:yes gene_type:complete